MAKSTKARGDTYTEAELKDPQPPVRIQRAELGVIDQCPPEDGTDSLPSSRSPEQSGQPTSEQDPSLAPTTVNPSTQTEQGSAVLTTDGGGQPAETEESTEDVPPYEDWTVKELQDECRARGLTVSGTKAELVSRLEEDDEQPPSEED